MIDFLRRARDLVTDFLRSHIELVAENALLRQQLIVAQRKIVGRPALEALGAIRDCSRRTLHAGMANRDHTRAAGHHPPLASHWTSRVMAAPFPTPRASADASCGSHPRDARQNPRWGAERIRGELLKLGYRVSKRTVQRYMSASKHPGDGQRWATFLASRLGPKTEPARVAFEACREGWHVHDKLAQWGHEPRMLDTTRIRQIGVGQHRRKNDPIDAEAMAQAVDVGRCPKRTSYLPSVALFVRS